MADVQINVTIYQMKEELIRNANDTVAGRLAQLNTENKLITITKSVTVKNIDRKLTKYTLEDFNTFLNQYRNAEYPYIRGEVEFIEV